MRTASRRARRLAGLLLLAAAVCWAFVRRRANAVRWVEPPATILPSGGAPSGAMPAGETGERAGVPVEPGAPGEIPDDILATDAGLTELPEAAADEGRADTVDETRVAEILADSAGDVVVVDETAYEQAIAGAAPEPPAAPPEHVDRAPAGPAPAVEESTASIRPEVDEATGRGIPMPTFSEAPTAEIPVVSDDLQAIRGIGPSMERKLHGLGIVSYRQLALLDGAELERVRAELTDFRGRIEREDWVGQARTLHREKYGRDPS